MVGVRYTYTEKKCFIITRYNNYLQPLMYNLNICPVLDLMTLPYHSKKEVFVVNKALICKGNCFFIVHLLLKKPNLGDCMVYVKNAIVSILHQILGLYWTHLHNS